jgi:hypothetical protein
LNRSTSHNARLIHHGLLRSHLHLFWGHLRLSHIHTSHLPHIGCNGFWLRYRGLHLVDESLDLLGGYRGLLRLLRLGLPLYPLPVFLTALDLSHDQIRGIPAHRL